MNTQHKQVLYQLLANSKFNLSPQDMVVALEAINALASEINAELAPRESVSPAKGGDPVTNEVSE